MVDFINEVEEELRKDDYNALLRRYGPYIAGVIVLIIAGTGFLEWRKSADDRLARATAASFTQAMNAAEQGNLVLASEKFIELSSVAPAGYAGLSLMQAAGIKLETGDRTEAVRLFDLAAQRFPQARHAQLAQLKAAYILAGDGAYEDVTSRLGNLISKDQPYEFLARELMGFAAQQSGDLAGAREQFSYLDTIPGVPAPVKERANQALTLMRSQEALNRPSDTLPDILPPQPLQPESEPNAELPDKDQASDNENSIANDEASSDE